MAMESWGQFSPDQRWWWSGQAWVPARSADGNWRWTGMYWVQARRLTWPSWLTVLAGSWIAVLGAWVPAAGVTQSETKGTGPLLVALGGSFGIAILMTVALGFVLGRRGWWPHLGLAIAGGTVALMWFYIWAWAFLSNSNDTTSDNAAAAGVILLFIPTLVLMSLLLGAGGGLGRLSRKVRPVSD